MDEKTHKNQDFHQLIYWVKEIFKQIDIFNQLIANKQINFQAIDNLNQQLAKLNLSLNFFKRFMVNFQIKYPTELNIIDLACKLAQKLDSVLLHSKNLEIDLYKKYLDKCNSSRVILLIAIIDHIDYTSITIAEKV